MGCKLIQFRCAAEWFATLFFAISGVICLSASFYSENLQDGTGLFGNERIILLVCGIVHLVLFVLAFLSLSYTAKILGNFLSEDDMMYKELMELVGLDKQPIHYSFDVEDEARSDVYSEPSEDPNDTSEKPEDKEAEAEVATKPQHLFNFTYKPGQNVPEELTYQEEFVAKLSSKVNFETFELEEDGYPPIFDIAIETSAKASENEKCSKTGAVCTIPEISKFVFTHKPKEGGQTDPERLKYNDKFVRKLPSDIDFEDIVLGEQAEIEEILHLE